MASKCGTLDKNLDQKRGHECDSPEMKIRSIDKLMVLYCVNVNYLVFLRVL